MTLEVAKRLFLKADVDLIQLRVDDIWAAPEIAQAIPDTLGDEYATEDWQDMNRSLFYALSLAKIAIRRKRNLGSSPEASILNIQRSAASGSLPRIVLMNAEIVS